MPRALLFGGLFCHWAAPARAEEEEEEEDEEEEEEEAPAGADEEEEEEEEGGEEEEEEEEEAPAGADDAPLAAPAPAAPKLKPVVGTDGVEVVEVVAPALELADEDIAPPNAKPPVPAPCATGFHTFRAIKDLASIPGAPSWCRQPDTYPDTLSPAIAHGATPMRPCSCPCPCPCPCSCPCPGLRAPSSAFVLEP